MEARADLMHRLRGHVPHLHLAHREAARRRLLWAGLAAGIAGGLVAWIPLLVYDWARGDHSALEAPMAVTGWLFGLEHFGQNTYHWWPIVIGALFMAAYFGLHGWAYAGLADRVYRVRTLAGSLALGAAWSFASFMLFWYMVLPIARDGAPFRPTAAGEFVAPAWVWIVGFAVSGIATALAYHGLRVRREPARAAEPERQPRAA